MIKPTIGRVVWFHPGVAFAEANNIAFGDPEQPLAATIAYVINEQMVNLSAVDQNGKQFNVTSVPLKQDDSDLKIGSYYCEWMPYQKEQAKLIETTRPFFVGIDLASGSDYSAELKSSVTAELPELNVATGGEPPIKEPCCSGSVANGNQLNEKRDNAFLVAQLLSNNKISPELRKKAESKMLSLLDELI